MTTISFPFLEHVYFKSDNFYLLCGDSSVLLKGFPDESIDLIFADPPYFLSNNGTTCHAGKRVSVNKGEWDKSKGWEENLMFYESWISECKRILKKDGTIWISGTMHNIFVCGYILQKLNFHILNDICWYKPNAAPNLACTTFAHSHETLIWAKKDKKNKHYFNYDRMKNYDTDEDKLKSKGKQMRSVWAINTPLPDEKEYGKHPTQKPLSLLKRILVASSKENSIILDPFNGGGTTGIACLEIGNRTYIGIDIEKSYLDLTIKRAKKYLEQTSLAI